MSEDAPTLLPNAQEVWQWTQAANSLRDLVLNLRQSRARDGRLANEASEHAAQMHEQRQHPPVRMMTDDEQLDWHRRIPSELAARQPEDGAPVSVWTAGMVDADGRPTGEWGVEAHTWDRGAPDSALFVVMRDADDALAMTEFLREEGGRESLARIHELAAAGGGQFLDPVGGEEAPAQFGAHLPGPAAEPALEKSALSESAWEQALRRHLPARVADSIVATDPAAPGHTAWRELHSLAASEVARVGADPDKLAELVHRVPSWGPQVRNPAALAHWALTDARSHEGYAGAVTASPTSATDGHTPVGHDVAVGEAGRLRLPEVRSPEQALRWADGLDAAHPEHHLEAKQGFGRWGPVVDARLATKFPSVVPAAAAAAKDTRRRTSAAAVATGAETASAAVSEESGVAAPPDPVVLEKLRAEVARMDPNTVGGRIGAHAMFGHVPVEIDRMLVEKFGDDPRFAEKVQTTYPDGLPEAEAASWRNRASGDEAAARAERATPDDPVTPSREDLDAAQEARDERGTAAAKHGIGNSVAVQPAATQRPIAPPRAPAPRRRA